MKTKEEFKDIPDFEGYKVSNYGRVMSNRHGEWRYLRPQQDAMGYLHVRLYKPELGRYPNGHVKAKLFKIHRLVLTLFSPHTSSKKLDVNHIDGVKTNNHISNLEWLTRSENCKHAVELGLNKVGQRRSKPLKVTYPNGEQKEFSSRVNAAKHLKV